MEKGRLKHWMTELDARELAQVHHAMEYLAHHASAGAPGHSQFVLIAKLTRQLEEREHAIIATVRTPVIQQVAWNESSKCWHDVQTGVIVEVP